MHQHLRRSRPETSSTYSSEYASGCFEPAASHLPASLLSDRLWPLRRFHDPYSGTLIRREIAKEADGLIRPAAKL
jgi:hypothetical protein